MAAAFYNQTEFTIFIHLLGLGRVWSENRRAFVCSGLMWIYGSSLKFLMEDLFKKT